MCVSLGPCCCIIDDIYQRKILFFFLYAFVFMCLHSTFPSVSFDRFVEWKALDFVVNKLQPEVCHSPFLFYSSTRLGFE